MPDGMADCGRRVVDHADVVRAWISIVSRIPAMPRGARGGRRRCSGRGALRVLVAQKRPVYEFDRHDHSRRLSIVILQ